MITLMRFRNKRGTSDEWELANTILLEGEVGLETDTNRFKFGDGVSTWSDLPYFQDESKTQQMIESAFAEIDPAAIGAEAIGVALNLVNTHSSDTTNIHGIANTADLETISGAQIKADAAQDAAEETAGNALLAHVNALNPHPVYLTQDEADAIYIALTQRAAANGVATLGADGKIPSSQLSALAISKVDVVSSQAAMLALVSETGDVAKRTDLNRTFILASEPATELTNWVDIGGGGDVLSVDGRTGAVSLNDLYAALVHNHDSRYYTETEIDSALAGKSDATHNHDSRYYTEAEIDSALAGKSDAGHSHGAGSSMATDPLWDVKGDMAVGTGSNTGARLGVGANGSTPVADSATETGYRVGNPARGIDVRPTSPSAQDDEFDDTTGMSGPTNGINSRWSFRNIGTAGWKILDNAKAPGAFLLDIPVSQPADQAMYQSVPVGDFQIATRVQRIGGEGRQMWGLFVVDTSGNGIAVLLDDSNSEGGCYMRSISGWLQSGAGAAVNWGVNYAWTGSVPVALSLRKAAGVYYGAVSVGDFTTKDALFEVAHTPAAFTPAYMGFARMHASSSRSLVAMDWFRRY